MIPETAKMSSQEAKKNGDTNTSSSSNGNRRRSRSPRDRRPDRNDDEERRVYVSNIPYEVKWMNIKDIFKEKVGEVAFVELYDDEKGKPKGELWWISMSPVSCAWWRYKDVVARWDLLSTGLPEEYAFIVQ